MSYAGRMVFRMYLPGVLVLAAGGVAAAGLKAAQQLPGDLGTLSLYSNLPAWTFGVALVVALTIGAVQTLRLRLWDRGAIAGCYVCGCLLGSPRAARRGLGLIRHCLGCGKVHGVNHHRLSPHVVPLAVAVKDTAAAPVRSVRSLP
ncbi:hypothetical protein [Luteibacter sp. 329MFSha]|uniref:hypothetical protein n=1 Tax=Luteibacter sp. 329MFSha TaxID=1798239 RepID=UPI0008CEB6BE|nr:hypothetical protein [Luteibacter sp. 329MFSha]SEW04171.1 hypothetical protein SAMN04515660_2032 [Luteibacter sp. 329MFSha]